VGPDDCEGGRTVNKPIGLHWNGQNDLEEKQKEWVKEKDQKFLERGGRGKGGG